MLQRLNSDMKLCLWASMHSRYFPLCRWLSPVVVNIYGARTSCSVYFDIKLMFRNRISFYYPALVAEEYLRAMGRGDEIDPYGDIPF